MSVEIPQVKDSSEKETQLQEGSYEIIRNRLRKQGGELRTRLDKLNHERREVFGSIETKLLATERITTENNCIPVDMVAIDTLFLFGYNVHMGLKTETALSDVFSLYTYENRAFSHLPLELINDQRFLEDFKNLYKYYRNTQFTKFAVIGLKLFMVFRVGKGASDIKTRPWMMPKFIIPLSATSLY
jgi:hypothetical protein